jgi:Zn-dependent protease
VNHEPTPPLDERPPVVEGQYLPPEPDPRASGRTWRAAGGTAVGFGLLLAKFKGLLLALLNFKVIFLGGKFALTAFSFLASIWFYALFFGWKFAIVFVLLIAIHELGHAVFVRGYGLSAPAIYFVPGFGAFTTWSGGTQSAFQESVIAFGGPLLGTLGGLACFGYGFATNEPFWYAAAYTAFFLNLFNMIPLGAFDGGRMTGAISPNFWFGGFVVVVAAAIAFHWWSPMLLLVVALSIPRAVQAWRGHLDPRYAAVTAAERTTLALAYFGLLAVLLACLVLTRVAVPGQSAI